MAKAKCCNCGATIKGMEPSGDIRFIKQCKSCGTKQYLEPVPGMEFFAAIPFSFEPIDIDEYLNNPGFVNAEKYIDTDFVGIATKVAKLVEEKQAQYGNQITSMGPILKELYPGGIKPDQYNDLTLIVRILDKIGRITKGNGEGNEDAWGDLLGYSLLGKANVQNRRS